MVAKEYYVKYFMLMLLFINKCTTGYDIILDEDVIIPNLNFTNNDTSGDYYDPTSNQEKHYQELNYKFSQEEDSTESGAYITMMRDNMQIIPEVYRNRGILETNQTNLYIANETDPFSITNNVDVDLSKNVSEEGQIMDKFVDYADQIEVGSTTQTPMVRFKQGKQIQIVKLLPHEALRSYIEDAHIRTPLAAVVDTATNSLEKIKVFWKDTLRPNAALDIILLAFNATGVSVTYHFLNTRTFLAGLESMKDDSSGNPFYGIIKASELVPYDSAIFVSTATVPINDNMARIAAVTLLKKRIRLYVIWFGDNTFSENETQEITGGILGEVAIRSGGEILHVDYNSTEEFDGNLSLLPDNNPEIPEEINLHMTPPTSQVMIDGPIQTATVQTWKTHSYSG